jgi:hypothetical protein
MMINEEEVTLLTLDQFGYTGKNSIKNKLEVVLIKPLNKAFEDIKGSNLYKEKLKNLILAKTNIISDLAKNIDVKRTKLKAINSVLDNFSLLSGVYVLVDASDGEDEYIRDYKVDKSDLTLEVARLEHAIKRDSEILNESNIDEFLTSYVYHIDESELYDIFGLTDITAKRDNISYAIDIVLSYYILDHTDSVSSNYAEIEKQVLSLI